MEVRVERLRLREVTFTAGDVGFQWQLGTEPDLHLATAASEPSVVHVALVGQAAAADVRAGDRLVRVEGRRTLALDRGELQRILRDVRPLSCVFFRPPAKEQAHGRRWRRRSGKARWSVTSRSSGGRRGSGSAVAPREQVRAAEAAAVSGRSEGGRGRRVTPLAGGPSIRDRLMMRATMHEASTLRRSGREVTAAPGGVATALKEKE